jgi:hypothetical protein
VTALHIPEHRIKHVLLIEGIYRRTLLCTLLILRVSEPFESVEPLTTKLSCVVCVSDIDRSEIPDDRAQEAQVDRERQQNRRRTHRQEEAETRYAVY